VIAIYKRMSSILTPHAALRTAALYTIGSCLFIATPPQVQANEIRYVSDTLRVELRSGPSNQHRIIAFLKTGMKLNQQASNNDNADWIQVSTMKGTSGWVRRQHISLNRASKELLQEAKNKILGLESNNTKQDEIISSQKKRLNALKNELSTLANNKSKVDREYNSLRSISNNAVQADKSNRDLRKKNEQLKIKVEELAINNERLEHDHYVDGITRGMFAVIVGCIMAFALMQLGGRKRAPSGWD